MKTSEDETIDVCKAQVLEDLVRDGEVWTLPNLRQ